MNPAPVEEDAELRRALDAASDTRILAVDPGLRHDAARVFASAFGDASAVIVADPRTYAAAGKDVRESFRRAGRTQTEPFLFGPDVHAEYAFVELLQKALAATPAIPVAVGSGTINDLTKLVAHRLGRQYMVVATAASVDGYTAYASSITYRGSKQMFDCPAPFAVLADLDVIVRAPREMNASGYADLLAKGVAGADWILAEAAGEEAIDPGAWATVQKGLPSWVASPGLIPQANPACLRHLVVGLMMSGFAMQAMKSSRPASGAEHQFSHLWDMQNHTHNGDAPSHGFKVGIGTLSSMAMYEVLLRRDIGRMDINAAVAAWPTLEQVEARIASLLGSDGLGQKAREEAQAKYIPPAALRRQLARLRDGWPALRERLIRHLQPYRACRTMLKEAGAAYEPEQIGIRRERLRLSFEQAYYIRRRFTVLDFARRFGIFDSAVSETFTAADSLLAKGGQA